MSDPKIEVPEHILDMVAERTLAYTVESEERWLGGLSDQERKDVLALSTHNIVETADRRELHRQILQEISQNIHGEPLEKPTLVLVVGPMAAGKTTLLADFDESINGNNPKGHYSDSYLQKSFDIYAESKERLMVSDFQLYKNRLPEFAENDNNFTVIRPEASGLDQAVIQWAQDLKVNIILEQLGDGSYKKLLQEKMPEYNIVVIGVTTDPEVNLERLKQRNAEKGEGISDVELNKTIQGFSGNEAYAELAQYASFTVLVNAGVDGYSVIHASENGQTVFEDKAEHTKFKSYAETTKGRPMQDQIGTPSNLEL